eukprot:993512-Pelagomonas_calceolata.AAC.4
MPYDTYDYMKLANLTGVSTLFGGTPEGPILGRSCHEDVLSSWACFRSFGDADLIGLGMIEALGRTWVCMDI